MFLCFIIVLSISNHFNPIILSSHFIHSYTYILTFFGVIGNDNTVGGGGVYPIGDLRELEGLKAGAKEPIEMIDGHKFNGAKAYKDSKICMMMTANMLHNKYAPIQLNSFTLSNFCTNFCTNFFLCLK